MQKFESIDDVRALPRKLPRQGHIHLTTLLREHLFANRPIPDHAANSGLKAFSMDTFGGENGKRGDRFSADFHADAANFRALLDRRFDRVRQTWREKHVLLVALLNDQCQISAELERKTIAFSADDRQFAAHFCAALGDGVEPVIGKAVIQHFLCCVEAFRAAGAPRTTAISRIPLRFAVAERQ